MQVGTIKDQGLYNKPSAAVHPGALAAGTLSQYNTIPPLLWAFMACSRLNFNFTFFFISTRKISWLTNRKISASFLQSTSYASYNKLIISA